MESLCVTGAGGVGLYRRRSRGRRVYAWRARYARRPVFTAPLVRHQWRRLTGAATRGSFGIDSPTGTEAMRTTKRLEDPSRCQGGPAYFHAKNNSAGAPKRPQRAGFSLGLPAPISARAGEKRAFGGATGLIFQRRRPKNRLAALVGGVAEDALSKRYYIAKTATNWYFDTRKQHLHIKLNLIYLIKHNVISI